MNRKKLGKLAIDLAMTVFLLVAMACRITGNTVHELVGVSIFVLFIVHNILNRRWYKTVLKKNNHLLRLLNKAINQLLLVVMVMLLVSAVYMSRIVFDFIPVNSSLIMRQIHVLSAYWGFVLISLHLGMHWRIVRGAVRRMTGITDTRRIHTIVLRVFVMLIVVYGVQASFDRNIGSKLILYYTSLLSQR